ncbi:Thiouridylase, cytoplasmic, subunit 2 [Cynara cardunculus var. scolymus]|uniref:Cytoplasmic tRNA 2-thiolation protein 2 n=1 Tax=Cynara cardunculus var. scolymus TaxID=59895 RepID=A0A124SIA8_CYNCS|nr:Thiouridylase, cytoplasmic, subunit 2 [Cynara cardunculus var. scolymus]
MDCNGTGCQTGCYKDSNGDGETENKSISVDSSHDKHQRHQKMCLKCKGTEATIFTGGDGGGRFCADCFRSNLYGKFKLAVTSNAMISPTDKVLVAFSGGPSSSCSDLSQANSLDQVLLDTFKDLNVVALQFVSEMQLKAQKNFDATADRDRSLPVFGVGVAFIDESEIHPSTAADLDKAVEDMKEIVLNLAPPRKELHVVPIRSICSEKTSDGRETLENLVNAIAIENGYTKLVLGSCTSRIACHVLAATVKGQGYSLAADIQYADARWEIPVVLPLRDCLMQELNILCSLDSLKIVEVFNDSRANINGLVSSFVKLLQEENPSRECTIVRTAGKLTPFPFNRIPEVDADDVLLASQRRQKKFNLRPIESLPPESFCPICNSPMNDLQNSSCYSNPQPNPELFRAACCSCCQYQVLPEEPSSMDQFYSFLPKSIITRAKDGNQKWIR